MFNTEEKIYPSKSIWNDNVTMPAFPRLCENREFDVCIVGGGIAGLLTAYQLQKENKKVCVLESLDVGAGQSGLTTAHFTYVLDERYSQLEKTFGLKGSKLAAESHRTAIDWIEQIVSEENIDCDLERVHGYLFSHSHVAREELAIELHAAHRAGLQAERITRAPIDSYDTGECLFFPRQLQLHPMKLMKALSEIILKRGGEIFVRAHVNKVSGGKDACVELEDGYKVRAQNIVVATNTPINDVFSMHTKMAPYRTYVQAFKVPKYSVRMGLFWDTADPYHYFRIHSWDETSDVLIVGGEDHKTGQKSNPDECYDNLTVWAKKRFPMIEDVLYEWSGQIFEPVDGLAYLGHNPGAIENVYIIAGQSGNGMTYSTIGALLIADQIMGRQNTWADLYKPSRKTLRTIGNYIRENANAISQYKDWVNFDSAEVANLAPGEGAVISDGLKKIAVYKDTAGNLELRSAMCTHLGGVVHWNCAEKSWDCPLHGSRFDCHGKVIVGPAVKDLALANEESPVKQEVLGGGELWDSKLA